MLQMMFVYGKERAQNIGHRFHLPDIAFFSLPRVVCCWFSRLVPLINPDSRERSLGTMQYKSAAIGFNNHDAL